MPVAQTTAGRFSQHTVGVVEIVLVVVVCVLLVVVDTVLLVVETVLLVLLVEVEEFTSSGQKSGGGASFRLSTESCLVVAPPNEAQYRFESVPTVSTMPTCPRNGVGSVTPLPLQTATTFSLTSTTRQPAPLYL